MDKMLSITNQNIKKIYTIEKLVYGDKAWPLQKFEEYLNQNNVTMRCTVNIDGIITTYFIYEDTFDNINILNITVNPAVKNGNDCITKIVEYLKKQLTDDRRCVRITVRDTDIVWQNFLKKLGFKSKLLPGFFNHVQDGITFTYRQK